MNEINTLCPFHHFQVQRNDTITFKHFFKEHLKVLKQQEQQQQQKLPLPQNIQGPKRKMPNNKQELKVQRYRQM